MSDKKKRKFWLFRLFYLWVFRLFRHGYKREITLKDLFSPSAKYRAAYCYERLMKHWTVSCHCPEHTITVSENKVTREPPKSSKSTPSGRTLWWCLIKAFWPCVVLTTMLDITFNIIRLFPAILLGEMIKFVGSNASWHVGAIYTCTWFLLNTAVYLSENHLTAELMYGGLQVRIALISAIYEKILKMSPDTQRKYTVGELVNLMAVDCENVYRLCSNWSLAFGGIFQLVLSTVLIWQYIGPASLTGFVVIAFLTILLAASTRISGRFQEKQLDKKDERLRVLNEIFSGIKTLKLYAWEPFFLNKTEQIRSKEESLLRRFLYCNGTTLVLFIISPMLISGIALAVYVFSNPENVLTPEKVFVSLSLFNNMRLSLVLVPEITSYFIQARISIRRILEFLLSEEQRTDNVLSTPQEDKAVSFNDATLSWSSNHHDAVLNNINFEVKKGELIAVVGSVGAGKSSLLNAILGDMYRLAGNVNVQGRIAYVPQQAWILNKNVRDNIVFTSDFNEQWYQEVTRKCCLKPDFESLPYRDLTAIGEKGVNLSGGQKQRVSLARAIYQQESDIYLLDDPLSAVDAYVAQQLFADVIGPQGLLRNKTRILVTHTLSMLPDVDRIVVIDNGTITEIGSYAEIVNSVDGNFQNFLNLHLKTRSTIECTEKNKTSGGDNQMLNLYDSTESVPALNVSNIDVAASADIEKSQLGKVKTAVYINMLKSMGPFVPILMIAGFSAYCGSQVGATLWLSAWSNDFEHMFGSKEQTILEEFIIDSNLTTIYYDQIVYRLNGFAIWVLLQAIFTAIGIVSVDSGVIRASSSLHNRMLMNVVRAPMSFYDVTPLGRIMNRFGKDVDNLDVELPPATIDFFNNFLLLIATAIVITIHLPWFAAAVCPIIAFYYFLTVLYIRTSRQVKRLQSVTRSPVYNHFSETIAGVNSVRAFQAQDHFKQQLFQKLDENQNCYLHSVYLSKWVAIQMDFWTTVLICSTCAFITLYRDNIDPAVAGLILSYAISTTEIIYYLTQAAVNLENALVSAERIEEYTQIKLEAPWKTDVEIDENWPHNGCVAFQDYSTRYRQELDLVLKNISLSINTSEKVGIVGRTGAGKSSLTMALFRLIEAAEGSISIDNIDISTLGLHQLRSRLTIIPQDPFLFCGTLRANIDPTNNYQDPDIWGALEKSHLASFVRSQKDALDMEINQGGSNISVGQRQLLCFARALLRQTRILVLDEATASIDAETDQLIQQTLRNHFNHCTTLTIAHRINTIIDYDRVVVLSDGFIVEEGAPNELINDKNSHFFQLVCDAGL